MGLVKPVATEQEGQEKATEKARPNVDRGRNTKNRKGEKRQDNGEWYKRIERGENHNGTQRLWIERSENNRRICGFVWRFETYHFGPLSIFFVSHNDSKDSNDNEDSSNCDQIATPLRYPESQYS